MGKSIHYTQRQKLVSLRQQGLTVRQITEQLNMSYWTVRQLCRRFRDYGQEGLSANYEACGQTQRIASALPKRAACWLKRLHPEWGAPFIHLKLVQRYGADQIASIRQLQRWFRDTGLTRPTSHTKDEHVVLRAEQVHQRWQVDAKERLVLADGQCCCYLSLIDERSGAALAAILFSILPH